ncbi:interleukin-1 receptor type 1 [Scomber japonicus]|uniref:interleukin-1 receptor type 1 n=1 Tax=Scomber japonicus TaxID=13676 RepID=UPI002304E6DA|nr:interleukin-1 receptor type 1 [Scomber japonicus]
MPVALMELRCTTRQESLGSPNRIEAKGRHTATDCEDNGLEDFNLLEGEAFPFVPSDLEDWKLPDEHFLWYKNSSKIEYISSDEKERIHYHSGALLFLNLSTEDSGFYTVQYNRSGQCDNYRLEVNVFNASYKSDEVILFGKIENSDVNKQVTCPDSVKFICDDFNGRFTWYKDFNILKDRHGDSIRIANANKDDEGIYTCICTWEHNHILYNSSGSRRLLLLEPSSPREPEILSNTDQFADEGAETKLNCSVFCGFNTPKDCEASWHVNGQPFVNTKGYNQTIKTITENPSKRTISTAILTIERVSAKDFQEKFECVGQGFYEEKRAVFTLKRRATIVPLVIGGLCALLLSVFLAMLVKYFAIDLALLFRPYFPLSRQKDAKLFDAYVVYQTPSGDKAAEDMFCQFVTKILPSVLEEKCGYRLFIHGRDDIPGEDRLELVEDRMKQSRRLMVILTSGSESEREVTDICPTSPLNSVGGFDWQVGLHQALIQREMNVILIQLGDTGPEGYTHLPPGLQHLIRCSAPIRWPESSSSAAMWKSRFWKRVRYLMPAKPASKSTQSLII